MLGGWLEGLGMARNGARNALPLPTEALQSQDTCAKQQFENKLERTTWKSQFPVLFYERKGRKIRAKRYGTRAQKNALAPRNTFTNKYREKRF